MQRRIYFAMFFLSSLCLSLNAQTTIGAISDFCVNGATKAKTSGSNSSNYQQGIIPACKVAVYLTGTTTLAPVIYSDGNNTVLTNPFTANTDGAWLFFAPANQGYDVQLSGGGGNGNCTTAPNCYTTPRTLTGLYPAQQVVGNTGPCSIFNGDTTSINCGANRVGDAATAPASVISIGQGGLPGNSGQQIVAIGSTPVSLTNSGSNVVAIGNNPQGGGGGTGSDVIAIGDNSQGGGGDNVVAIGDSAGCTGVSHQNVSIGYYTGCPTFNEGVMIGDSNSGGDNDAIGIGDTNLGLALGNDLVAIGDHNMTAKNGETQGQYFRESIAIGDFSMNNFTYTNGFTFSDEIAIGAGAMYGLRSNQNDGMQTDFNIAMGQNTLLCLNSPGNTAIGHNSDAVGDSGGRNTAVGNQAMAGFISGSPDCQSNTHQQNVAMGFNALGADTSGSYNVAIGAYAGADQYNPNGGPNLIPGDGTSGKTNGNANQTGSQNTWLGYDSGPGSTTQLDNTIAIGYKARVTQSNQAVIGNSTITQTKLYGTVYLNDIAVPLGAAKQWSCQTGIGDGVNAISAATYPQHFCVNTTGSTVTLTGISCWTDAGTSTLAAVGTTFGALLTGAVTCSNSTPSGAAGSLTGGATLVNGEAINFSFVADGTAKQTTWVVAGTY